MGREMYERVDLMDDQVGYVKEFQVGTKLWKMIELNRITNKWDCRLITL